MLTSGFVGLSKMTHQAFKIRFTTITHSGGKKDSMSTCVQIKSCL